MARTDIEHIEELVEKLLEKKLISSRERDEEKQNGPPPFLSERVLFERILNIESEIKALHIEIKNRGELLEKILHQIDKRFEQVDKRFEQVDKRFEELREDMNKRFSQLFWFIGLFIPLSNTLLLLGLTYIIK